MLGAQGELFKGAALFAPMLSLERASHHGLNYYLRYVSLSPVLHMRGCSTRLACAKHTGPSVTALLRMRAASQPYCAFLMPCMMHSCAAKLIWLMLPDTVTLESLLHLKRQVLQLKIAMLCLMYRPLAALLSWIWPTLPAASTTRNHLYPELQALWDQGTT